MYRIEILSQHHKTALFDCGDERKTRFLSQYALQNTKGGLGRTFVAVRPAEPELILGYYTVSSSSVSFDNPPPHLPRYPLPTVLIGKLAVDLSAQGQGLATRLLFDALKRADRVAEEIGIFLVEIQAIDGRARALYEKHGFLAMTADPNKLFLNLKSLRKLLAES